MYCSYNVRYLANTYFHEALLPNKLCIDNFILNSPEMEKPNFKYKRISKAVHQENLFQGLKKKRSNFLYEYCRMY